MNKKMVLIIVGVISMGSCAQAAEKEFTLPKGPSGRRLGERGERSHQQEASSELKQLIKNNELEMARVFIKGGATLTDADLYELLPNAEYNKRLVKLGIVSPPPPAPVTAPAAKPASSAGATTVPAATTAAKPTTPAASTAATLTPPAATTAAKPVDAAVRPVKTAKEVEEFLRQFAILKTSYNDLEAFIQNNDFDRESVNAVNTVRTVKSVYKMTLFLGLVEHRIASAINYALIKKLLVDGLALHASFDIGDAYTVLYTGTVHPALNMTRITAEDFIFNVAEHAMSKISKKNRSDLIAPTRAMLQALIDGLRERSVPILTNELQEKNLAFGDKQIPALYGIIAGYASNSYPQDQEVLDEAEKLLAELNKLAASKGK